MLFFSKKPFPANKPIDWIGYAAQMLRQAEHAGLFQFSAYAALTSNNPTTSHGQIPDPALDGSTAAVGEH